MVVSYKSKDAPLETSKREEALAAKEKAALLQEVSLMHQLNLLINQRRVFAAETMDKLVGSLADGFDKASSEIAGQESRRFNLKFTAESVKGNCADLQQQTSGLLKQVMTTNDKCDKHVSLKPMCGYVYYLPPADARVRRTGKSKWHRMFLTFVPTAKRVELQPCEKSEDIEPVSLHLSTAVKDLADAHTSKRHNTITLREKGDERVHVIQALTASDCDRWLKAMSPRHRPGTVYVGKKATTLDQKESGFLQRAIRALESKDLKEEGIYREPGSVDMVDELLTAMTTKKPEVQDQRLQQASEKDIASVIKKVMRDSKAPIIPEAMVDNLLACTEPSEKEERLSMYSAVLQTLPDINRQLLRVVMVHLHVVHTKAKSNKMEATALAGSINPSLLHVTDPLKLSRVYNKMQTAVEDMIRYPQQLFDVEEDMLVSRQASAQADFNSNPSSSRNSTDAGIVHLQSMYELPVGSNSSLPPSVEVDSEDYELPVVLPSPSNAITEQQSQRDSTSASPMYDNTGEVDDHLPPIPPREPRAVDAPAVAEHAMADEHPDAAMTDYDMLEILPPPVPARNGGTTATPPIPDPTAAALTCQPAAAQEEPLPVPARASAMFSVSISGKHEDDDDDDGDLPPTPPTLRRSATEKPKKKAPPVAPKPRSKSLKDASKSAADRVRGKFDWDEDEADAEVAAIANHDEYLSIGGSN
eukprot:TRINITY_DN6782_c0_g1_i1.p1 TRINITY_DN6782_c0_g1~~TRINITY_DN6782_c0_g1_i1.p1  ORF type:complete len:700 (+),score=180.94 TRINITY_DN6782_c0_g1_i1:369-2468(+)